MNNYIVDSLLTNEDIFLGKVKLMTISSFDIVLCVLQSLFKWFAEIPPKCHNKVDKNYNIYLFKERNTFTEKKKNKEILEKQR